VIASELPLVEVRERREAELRRRRRDEVRAGLLRGGEGVLPRVVADWPDDWRDAWEERVALMVVGGLLDEQEARRLAEERVRIEHARVVGLLDERENRSEAAAVSLSP
jgi:hypothetical protein